MPSKKWLLNTGCQFTQFVLDSHNKAADPWQKHMSGSQKVATSILLGLMTKWIECALFVNLYLACSRLASNVSLHKLKVAISGGFGQSHQINCDLHKSEQKVWINITKFSKHVTCIVSFLTNSVDRNIRLARTTWVSRASCKLEQTLNNCHSRYDHRLKTGS